MPDTDMTAGQWLSIEQFCEELDIPMSTAYKWSASNPSTGRFPRHTRLPNGRIRIRRDWLDAWLVDREVTN